MGFYFYVCADLCVYMYLYVCLFRLYRQGTGKALVARWEPSPTLPAHLELEAQLPCIFAGVRFQIQCKLQG